MSSSSCVVNTSAVSWESRNATSAAIQQYVHFTCTNCKNYSRAIIISLVRKNAANIIRGQIQFENEIHLRKYGKYMYVHDCTHSDAISAHFSIPYKYTILIIHTHTPHTYTHTHMHTHTHTHIHTHTQRGLLGKVVAPYPHPIQQTRSLSMIFSLVN